MGGGKRFFPITDSENQNNIIYQVIRDIPVQAIETPVVTIPDLVPLVGGEWGLEPVQMRVTVGFHSGGIIHREPIIGTGTLHFAGEAYEVKYDGEVITTINSNNGIEVLDSPFTISLENPVKIEELIPLGQFVPVLGQVFNLPVIGSILEEFFSPVFIQMEVMADVTGSGIIGVLASGELGIKEGTVNLNLTVTAAGGANVLNLAWFGLAGTLAGNVELSLAPFLETEQCNMQMSIQVVGGTPLGSLNIPTLFTQIPLCGS